MKYVLVLSKEMPNLAAAEALSLAEAANYKLVKNVLILDIKNNEIIGKLSKRLAYTSSIYSLLFESSYNDFIKKMESFDWNSIYKGSFCIRANKMDAINNGAIKNNAKKFKNKNKHKNKPGINNIRTDEKLYSEKHLAAYVWNSVKNPKVKLENPKTKIEIFFAGDKAYCCLLLRKSEHAFDERKAHLRPRPNSASLQPKLARALINLTGAKEGEAVLDPFCGSGGILIEAGLMGLRTIGYDLSRKMVWGAMVNLRHYAIENSELKAKDFFKLNGKYSYVAADLPYGLNASIMENIRVTSSNKIRLKKYLDKFYSGVIKKLEKILLKRAVVVFPSYFNYKAAVKKTKLKITNEFENYVHSNLTRKIVVLEK